MSARTRTDRPEGRPVKSSSEGTRRPSQGTTTGTTVDSPEVIEVHPLASVAPMLDEQDLRELADSIATVGLLNPIVLIANRWEHRNGETGVQR